MNYAQVICKKLETLNKTATQLPDWDFSKVGERNFPSRSIRNYKMKF